MGRIREIHKHHQVRKIRIRPVRLIGPLRLRSQKRLIRNRLFRICILRRLLPCGRICILLRIGFPFRGFLFLRSRFLPAPRDFGFFRITLPSGRNRLCAPRNSFLRTGLLRFSLYVLYSFISGRSYTGCHGCISVTAQHCRN